MTVARFGWQFVAGTGLCVMAAMPAQAMNFTLGDARVAFNSRALLGGAVRLSDRAPETIGKLNLNPDLCPDDCISFTGAQEPNQRLVDAPGAFLGSIYDDGNLHYDQWDLVSAQARLESSLNVQWGEAIFQVSGLAFFDEINNNFSETNTDTAFQPAHVPRNERITRQVGFRIANDLRDVFAARDIKPTITGFPLTAYYVPRGKCRKTMAPGNFSTETFFFKPPNNSNPANSSEFNN